MPIAQRKVDCDAELNLAATEDILQKRVPLVEHNAVKSCALVAALAHQLELNLALAKLGDVAADEAKVDMLSTLLRLEKFNPDLALRVLVCQLRRQDGHHVPREAASKAARDLALVDRLVVSWAHEFVNEEKVEAVLRGERSTQLEVCFLIVNALALICDDLDRAALTSGPLVALEEFL